MKLNELAINYPFGINIAYNIINITYYILYSSVVMKTIKNKEITGGENQADSLTNSGIGGATEFAPGHGFKLFPPGKRGVKGG